MQIRSRPLVLIYSALNAVGVLLIAVAFLAPHVWHPLIIVIDGATVGRVVFLAIPIGLLAARAFGKVAAEPKRSVRRYLRISAGFLVRDLDYGMPADRVLCSDFSCMAGNDPPWP